MLKISDLKAGDKVAFTPRDSWDGFECIIPLYGLTVVEKLRVGEVTKILKTKVSIGSVTIDPNKTRVYTEAEFDVFRAAYLEREQQAADRRKRILAVTNTLAPFTGRDSWSKDKWPIHLDLTIEEAAQLREDIDLAARIRACSDVPADDAPSVVLTLSLRQAEMVIAELKKAT